MFTCFLKHYPNPTPRPTPHRKLSEILDFQKASLSMIYKLVSWRKPKNVPTRSTFSGIISLVGTFGPHNVINTRYTHTHTHTHTVMRLLKQKMSGSVCPAGCVISMRIVCESWWGSITDFITFPWPLRLTNLIDQSLPPMFPVPANPFT